MKKLPLLLILLTLPGIYFLHAQGQQSDSLAQLQQSAEQLSRAYFDDEITLDEFNRQYTELGVRMQAIVRQMEQDSPSLSDDQANRIENLMEQSKLLEMRHNNNLVTDEYFTAGASVLKNELDLLTGPYTDSLAAQRQLTRISKTIDDRWPGLKPGWPPAWDADSVGELCGLGPFTQSQGTRASYSIGKSSVFDPVSLISIYQTSADDRVLTELKNQVEKLSGKTMEYRGDNTYRVDVVNQKNENVYLEIYFYRDVVLLTIGLYQ
ncbi:MAG: hypothetical protein FWD78_06355 [Treponema sp.]|nr:hypothetical protein [Treponema sp.]